MRSAQLGHPPLGRGPVGIGSTQPMKRLFLIRISLWAGAARVWDMGRKGGETGARITKFAPPPAPAHLMPINDPAGRSTYCGGVT
jgi:hypothetical protein